MAVPKEINVLDGIPKDLLPTASRCRSAAAFAPGGITAAAQDLAAVGSLMGPAGRVYMMALEATGFRSASPGHRLRVAAMVDHGEQGCIARLPGRRRCRLRAETDAPNPELRRGRSGRVARCCLDCPSDNNANQRHLC